jgi:hypothetical protein
MERNSDVFVFTVNFCFDGHPVLCQAIQLPEHAPGQPSVLGELLAAWSWAPRCWT